MQKKNMKYKDGWIKTTFPCIISEWNGQDCSHFSKRIYIIWIFSKIFELEELWTEASLSFYLQKFNFPDHRPLRLYWASSLILFQFYCLSILSIQQYNTIQSRIELSMLNWATPDLLYLTRNKGFIDNKISQ